MTQTILYFDLKGCEKMWFDDVFLPSVFKRARATIGEPLWLTRKQTAVCVQYMHRQTVYIESKTSSGYHDNYVYSWNGRTIELCYSSKNGCGSIVFYANESEQKQIAEESQKRRRQRDIESAKRLFRRDPGKWAAKVQKIKQDIEECRIDIQEDTREGNQKLLEMDQETLEGLSYELSILESVSCCSM